MKLYASLHFWPGRDRNENGGIPLLISHPTATQAVSCKYFTWALLEYLWELWDSLEMNLGIDFMNLHYGIFRPLVRTSLGPSADQYL